MYLIYPWSLHSCSLLSKNPSLSATRPPPLESHPSLSSSWVQADAEPFRSKLVTWLGASLIHQCAYFVCFLLPKGQVFLSHSPWCFCLSPAPGHLLRSVSPVSVASLGPSIVVPSGSPVPCKPPEAVHPASSVCRTPYWLYSLDCALTLPPLAVCLVVVQWCTSYSTFIFEEVVRSLQNCRAGLFQKQALLYISFFFLNDADVILKVVN